MPRPFPLAAWGFVVLLGVAGIAAPSAAGIRPGGTALTGTATVETSTGPGLSITSFTIVPSTVVKATPMVLNVTVVGGTPPLTFAYSNLPVGCPSLNETPLACDPGEVRTFDVIAQVTDLVGDVATANATLTVTPGGGTPPTITSFTAGPSSVAVGEVTLLTVVAASQSTTPTSALSYTYLGLPLGCATFNESTLECVPQRSGTYVLHVQVTDGFGLFAVATTNLSVTGSEPSAPAAGAEPGPVWVYGLALGAIVVAGVIVARRPRRRRPPPPPSPPE